MNSDTNINGYKFHNADAQPASILLSPHLLRFLQMKQAQNAQPIRVFDLGCGNGAMANLVNEAGYSIAGIDPSQTGISQANKAYPSLDLTIGSAYDDLASRFGSFDLVYSFEVVEHLYDPQKYAQTLFELLRPDGIALVSTPYHGYLKNLLLAATGKMDSHFTALWVHGHIKFWSIRTLSQLLGDAGLSVSDVIRVGRVPPLAKSMLAVAHKPT